MTVKVAAAAWSAEMVKIKKAVAQVLLNE